MTTMSTILGPHAARNYEPLPVVLERGEGVWVWDTAGRRYLDMLGAYSAVSFGHCHPRLVAALTHQAKRLDTISRVFHCRELDAFLTRACELTGYDRALPMNTGAEAVETALKAARRWGCEVKGIPADKAEIICCEGNFHGRTITITGMSTVAQYRAGFGPFPPGFRRVSFGDADALEAAITPATAAFLVEPVQGEGGIVLPPAGYLARVAEICRRNNLLLIADEVQTGLGRTGKLLASWHDGIQPDGVTLGKALGGGLVPVSLFLARREVMDVFRPGDHGSTFGGNPIAAAVGLEALNLLVEADLCARSAELGEVLLTGLRAIESPLIREVRGLGLFVGIELDRRRAAASLLVDRLLEVRILTKDTHRNTVRFAPPLTIERSEIDWAVAQVGEAVAELERNVARAGESHAGTQSP